MVDQPVLLSSDDSGVRTLTLNRPAAYNALTTELKETLLAELRRAAGDDEVRAVVLTGSGRAFCAGQDLRQHLELLAAGDPAPLRTVEEHYNPLVRALAGMPKPVIAAINGTAAGAGAGLAFACDLRVAAESAKFVLAFGGIGLTADSGVSWTLPRLIGYGRAMEVALLGEPIDARRALELGLVTRLAPDGTAAEAAAELAARLAAGPTVAYAKLKEAMLAAAGSDLEHALSTEARTQAEAGRTTDHAEAVAAFVAKRTPHFHGH